MTDALVRRARALSRVIADLRAARRPHALVGGLAVSARGEPRFTRDVDLAVPVVDDAEAERVVRELIGYQPVALVEHETVRRLSTVRLRSPEGTIVDLLFASTGIEAEIVGCATPLDLPEAEAVLVARSEELVAMKVLSMRENRLQDRMDAFGLLSLQIDIEAVRADLELITERGYHRGQDLLAKLDALLAEHAAGA